MLFNRISPRLAAGIGAAGLTATALFAATAYFGGGDPGKAAGAAMQVPQAASDEDFFADVQDVSDDQRASQREETQERVDAAGGGASASGTTKPEEKEPEPEEEEEESSSDSGSPAPDSSADANSLNWPALAQCESGGDPTAVNSAGGYYGLYQFSMATWESVGGSGSPAEAPADEQTSRAKALYDAVGGNWQSQWPECGVHLFD
ncbi:transglycosylase family protein [Nocardiopsis potens]|uniref:transglycosylase family protein n=1 Tax=Nocardiopsis potens TaxID=1246458 RepID=UPI000345DE08|nr:transglycosylase family protein [Nocardiopsis potens]